MTSSTTDFHKYVFSAQPDFVEAETRRAFAKLMPLKTIVIYCFDPRAAGIPDAIAEEFGETYPGAVVHDADGKEIGADTSMLTVVVAGGRAIDALRSVTVGQHLLGVENIVVVHHTHCGATSYTEDGIVQAFSREHGRDIAGLYPSDSVCITDHEAALDHDVRLLREAAGTPPHAKIFGYMYDIESGALTRLAEAGARQ